MDLQKDLLQDRRLAHNPFNSRMRSIVMPYSIGLELRFKARLKSFYANCLHKIVVTKNGRATRMSLAKMLRLRHNSDVVVPPAQDR